MGPSGGSGERVEITQTGEVVCYHKEELQGESGECDWGLSAMVVGKWLGFGVVDDGDDGGRSGTRCGVGGRVREGDWGFVIIAVVAVVVIAAGEEVTFVGGAVAVEDERVGLGVVGGHF